MKTLLATMAIVSAWGTTPVEDNWCRVGQMVMIPDGREGPVTSLEGDMCEVLVYGQGYITQWAYYVIEPSYPRYGR